MDKMKNKKAQTTGIIIGIIFGILMIGLIVTGLIIAYQKGYFVKNPQNEEEPTIKLYLIARDSSSQEPVDANYVIDYTENKNPVIISEGTLDKDSFTEIIVPNNKIIHAYCWNDNHYLVKASKQFSPIEIQSNISKFACDMVKISDSVKVTHTGDLSKENNIIKLNITVKDWFYKLSICFSWSPGIIDVSLPNQIITCNVGNWLNWSSYNPETKEYIYLENNYYKCGDDRFEQCEYIEENKCKLFSEEIPNRYREIADSCVYFGENLHDESYEVELNVRTLSNKNKLDFLEVILYDKDRRFDSLEQRWLWKSEINGEDISFPDFTYKIPYMIE